ncbi:MAG TPA: hypothetical protein VGD56_21400 [Gemmatirosa sp.]
MADIFGMSGGGMAGVSSIVQSVTQALTTLDPKQGAGAIEQVLGAIKGMPGTEQITGTLTSLHQQLTGGAPGGTSIGGLLSQLSTQTRTIAGGAGPIGAGLNQLADRLGAVSTQVGAA